MNHKAWKRFGQKRPGRATCRVATPARVQLPLSLRSGFDICDFEAVKAARAGRYKRLPKVLPQLPAQFIGCCFRINENYV